MRGGGASKPESAEGEKPKKNSMVLTTRAKEKTKKIQTNTKRASRIARVFAF